MKKKDDKSKRIVGMSSLFLLILTALGLTLVSPASAGASTAVKSMSHIPARNVTIARTASHQVGKHYRYGAEGPKSFDCSGLAAYSYRSARMPISHSAQAQYNQFHHHLSYAQVLPGDLAFYHSHHDGVYHVAVVAPGNHREYAAVNPSKGVRAVTDKYAMGHYNVNGMPTSKKNAVWITYGSKTH